MTASPAIEGVKRITINPVTRLEGHGRIEILLNHEGKVAQAFFQVPELRGFEKFAQGRPAAGAFLPSRAGHW